jgi:hypothetical protein
MLRQVADRAASACLHASVQARRLLCQRFPVSISGFLSARLMDHPAGGGDKSRHDPTRQSF